MAFLRVKHGRGEAYDKALEREVTTIGRGPANDLHFHNPWLSRLHAHIVARDGGHTLLDRGSRNGTYLNGRKIDSPCPLRHGDRIGIGDIQLRYMTSPSALQVSGDGRDPLADGTVVLGSDELSFDRYQETAEQTAASGTSLLPALNAAASALLVHMPLDRLVERVLALIADAVPSERAALLLRRSRQGGKQGDNQGEEQGELAIEGTRGYGENDDVEISRTLIDAVLEEGRGVLTVDVRSDRRFEHAQSILIQGIRSIICVPLWNNREVIGLVYLDQRQTGRVFAENDLRLVGLIANMAAVKIENTQLLAAQRERERFAEQMAVGAQIQRKLLPAHAPEVPGYDLFGLNRSCFAIGGDYYDFVPQEDGTLALVIADISGKGIGAALLMAGLQASLRALIQIAASPAELIDRLNRVLIDNSPYNKFATIFFARLDPRSHILDYVNGGHNGGLLRRGTSVESLPSTGPIVGMIEEAAFTSHSVELQPGDTLLLFTDGVTERVDAAGEEYGVERLARLLGATALENGSAALVEEVIAANNAFAPAGRADDDITLVALRRLAGE